MSGEAAETISVEFDRGEYERLTAVSEAPSDLLHEAAMDRVELEEAIDYTQEGGFHGPEGFARMARDEYPTWPLGSLLGIELESIDDGESRWTMDATAAHANPMGTLHGGVLCALGDTAISSAYMTTLEADELFTTVDLTIRFLEPVRTERLEAVGRVVHEGRRLGVAECVVSTDDGTQVARLSGTCMTLDET